MAEILDPARVEFYCAAEPWFIAPRLQERPSSGKVPERFRAIADSLPDSLAPVRDLYTDAANQAEAIYRKQILKELGALDVKASCAREKWCDKPLEYIGDGRFGYMPERYLEASERFAEGDSLRAQFLTAYDEADLIYQDQMRDAARAFATGIARLDAEAMRDKIWNLCAGAGKTDSDLGCRLLWLANAVCVIQQNGSPPRVREPWISGEVKSTGKSFGRRGAGLSLTPRPLF